MTNGSFDPLVDQPWRNTLRRRTPRFLSSRMSLPPEANVTAKRITTPTFGDGLIDAIPDWEIALNSVIPHADGVHGEISIVQDVVSGDYRVGRFGWKAQQATLLALYTPRTRSTMRWGSPTASIPCPSPSDGELCSPCRAQYESLTAPPKDEIDPSDRRKAGIDRLTDYMRYLAPPPPGRAQRPSHASGAWLSPWLGCASCHVPDHGDGPQRRPGVQPEGGSALFRPAAARHLGGHFGVDESLRDPASTSQMRTSPLWGLRARTVFLHDGRATTLDGAIRAHDGEAAVAGRVDTAPWLIPSAKPSLPFCRHCRTEPRGVPVGPHTSVKVGGKTRNRTGDTRIFSPLLYQLSYLAV